MTANRPTLALAMGDPAGVSPELTARALADADIRAAADLIVIGDRRVLEAGARIARVDLDLATIGPESPLPASPPPALLIDLGHCHPAAVEPARVARAGGVFGRENYLSAVALAAAGVVGAVTFTPFNKASMRLAVPGYDDEISFTATAIGFTSEAREFNVLDGLWNARVTSHVPLKDVAALLTEARIVQGLKLTDRAMRDAGFAAPRIGVAALNPHAGDNGNFGREEIDVLEPAVQAGRAAGIDCTGPFPSDTVFVRARAGQFDAVLTMYHDQGQIAMKLIGFDKGVTLLGGFPFPVCTPAHGTAFDIAGKGIANPGATRNALLLAARMASRQPPTRRPDVTSLSAARACLQLGAIETAA
jgi:4-hydroxythreonine-4-phosphate dehydrogenase